MRELEEMADKGTWFITKDGIRGDVTLISPITVTLKTEKLTMTKVFDSYVGKIDINVMLTCFRGAQ